MHLFGCLAVLQTHVLRYQGHHCCPRRTFCLLILSPCLGTPENAEVTQHLRPLLGPREGRRELATSNFVPVVGGPRECKGYVALPPSFGSVCILLHFTQFCIHGLVCHPPPPLRTMGPCPASCLD